MYEERDNNAFAAGPADAAKETGRQSGEEGVTLEDEPGEGEISEHPERQL